jgi:hypothetical protein
MLASVLIKMSGNSIFIKKEIENLNGSRAMKSDFSLLTDE